MSDSGAARGDESTIEGNISRKPPQHLLELLVECRKKEVKRRAGEVDIDSLLEVTVLDGWCHENALALAEHLHYADTEYEPYIVWGAIASERQQDYESIRDAEESGSVHLWVEARHPDTDETVVLDLSGEGSKKNDPVCRHGLPQDYRYPIADPCHIRYDPELVADDLLDTKTYAALRTRRPELFAEA